MANSISNNSNADTLQTIRALDTPGGKVVLQAFTDEMTSTGDVGRSFGRAVETAKSNGTLLTFQISIVADLVKLFGPWIMSQLQSQTKSK